MVIGSVMICEPMSTKSVGSKFTHSRPVAYPGILFGGGFQQIQLRTEDRENGDLEAVAR